jgi:alginate O-acetyltransferase complex protein AlgI
MLFNSLEYLFFYSSALLLAWLLIGLPRLRIWVLLLASYYFYAANNHWLIVLIILSTQVDYLAGLKIADSTSTARRKLLLTISVVSNLGILGVFKYFNFFASSVADIAGRAGLTLGWTELNVILPVGISFYTFQSMSYTIDVYRGQLKPERSWARFAFYVAYFPQLVAGPIMRASQFIPQLSRKQRLTPERFESGVALIMMGLIKKIVCGDYLARFANPVFADPVAASGFDAWLGLYAFTFQIYFDFSGYSDIAIGCSRLMGYELPDNFRRPYMARSFSDFWRRWHISLSSWLRDYLYIPLGGNRMRSRWGVHRNLMLTMLLGGLWHGAGWLFVLWGFLHGTYLIVERLLAARRSAPRVASSGLGLLVRRLAIFHAVVLTWLVFRCESLEQLWQYLGALGRVGVPSTVTTGMLAAIVLICFGWLAQLVNEQSNLVDAFINLPIPVKGSLYATASLVVAVFNVTGATPFIYFRF